jgi:hypothetical protein
MLIPYSRSSELLAERELGGFGKYLRRAQIRKQLEARTCVARKPWYAFHETPPLDDILRPKILCKDVTPVARFWIDRSGTFVPRHSVYYIVPSDPNNISNLCNFLNSEVVARWLAEHCQRATNGFLRLQSHILKSIPLPRDLAQPRLQRTFEFEGGGQSDVPDSLGDQ